MQTVAAVPALALLAGCAVGLLLPSLPLLIGFLLLTLASAGAAWAWRRSNAALVAAFVAIVFFAGGTILAVDAWHRAWRPSLRVQFEELARRQREQAAGAGRNLPEDDSAFAVLTGVLRADASIRPDGASSLSLAVQSIDDRSVTGGVILSVGGTLIADRINAWRAGRTIRAPVILHRPSRYLDPGVPDDERALARRGTTLVGSIKSGALVEVVTNGSWLAERAAAARAYVRGAIAAAVGRWSSQSAAIVAAIVLGDRAGLDDRVERRLQEAGTYHVIAISGGNIAILAGLAMIGFRIAGFLGRAAMITAIVALLGYASFVGGGASVNRATLMAVIYFAARAIDLRGPPANILALVAGLLVAAQPLAVVDAGFLLTFGATAAILVAVPVVPLQRFPTPIAAIAAMFVASLAAEAALLPVSAVLFQRVTVAGLILNFAAIPLMAVAQIAGMALVPVSTVSPSLAAAVGWVAHIGATGLVRSADFLNVAPFLSWRVPPPHWSTTTAYYIGGVTAWLLWRRRVRITGSSESITHRSTRIAAVLATIAAAIWITAGPVLLTTQSDGRLHVTFIDVGQGDAALVRFPDGRTLLVDAGGLSSSAAFDIGDRVVAPVLRAAGIRHVDSVAVTHGDIDHIGGAEAIVREFRPTDVWEGIPVPPLDVRRALEDAARAVRARWVNVQTGDLMTVGDVQIVVRHPHPAEWERQDVRNDDSIVLELIWRDVSIVLTGDIGREVEHEILPLFPASRLRVLKVPHHGSLTSSSREFIRALAPRIAIVSAGRANSFGHPAREVLDRYREAAVHIFRTDQDGAVTVDSDGYSLDVRTFTGQRLLVKGSRPQRD